MREMKQAVFPRDREASARDERMSRWTLSWFPQPLNKFTTEGRAYRGAAPPFRGAPQITLIGQGRTKVYKAAFRTTELFLHIPKQAIS